jgi:hypothetical protein
MNLMWKREVSRSESSVKFTVGAFIAPFGVRAADAVMVCTVHNIDNGVNAFVVVILCVQTQTQEEKNGILATE